MIDQSKVSSGFDVEALLGEQYLTTILLTALDSGVIPARTDIPDPHIIITPSERLNTPRLYDPLPNPDGLDPEEYVQAFDVEILFAHQSGADLRIRLFATIEQVGGTTFHAVMVDLFVTLAVPTQRDPEGALIDAGLAITVVDFDSPLLPVIEAEPYNISKATLLARIKEHVDRTISVGGASSFKRVEAVTIKKHPADGDHPAAVGLYLNIRLRTGDEDTSFKDARGDVANAINFLPTTQDIAFASRPGLYADLGKDTFHRTAFKNDLGEFEHALRPNLFNPSSKRLGTIHSVSVKQATDIHGVPLNGLRVVVEAEYEPDPDVNPDITITIDIFPTIGTDGLLQWSAKLYVSIDAFFEFLTIFAFTWLAIMFGGIVGAIFLGAIMTGEIGAGIYLENRFADKVSKRADATLTDVIMDRLKIKRRRWDPFFTTVHEVVTKPSLVGFNDKGFLLAGTAFVGRETVPVDTVVIGEETRDEQFKLTGLRYRIEEFESIQDDLKGFARGAVFKDYTQSDPSEPDLYDLSLDQIEDRFSDQNALLLARDIPYYPARVHLFEHKIEQLLCVSGREIANLNQALRNAFADRKYNEIVANDGATIRAQVIIDLTVNGIEPSEDAIAAEVEARIQTQLIEIMRSVKDRVASELTQELRPLLRFDVSPVELSNLRERHILTLDEIDTVQERLIDRAHRRYLRDHPDFDKRDNLLNRPRYRRDKNGKIEFTTFP